VQFTSSQGDLILPLFMQSTKNEVKRTQRGAKAVRTATTPEEAMKAYMRMMNGEDEDGDC
jgi:hypothetical protein